MQRGVDLWSNTGTKSAKIKNCLHQSQMNFNNHFVNAAGHMELQCDLCVWRYRNKSIQIYFLCLVLIDFVCFSHLAPTELGSCSSELKTHQLHRGTCKCWQKMICIQSKCKNKHIWPVWDHHHHVGSATERAHRSRTQRTRGSCAVLLTETSKKYGEMTFWTIN